MRVAVADVGTNSSHLLIAEAQEGSYRVLDSLKDRTRLGDCLDDGGNLTPEGEDRLASALTHFRELARGAGVGDVRVYATSALREAPNGTEVAQRMLERTGIYPAIISGEREGELTYLGVAHSVELGPDNVLLDLGGGSLELVRGDQQQARDVLSLPLGSIRMTRQYVPGGVGHSHELQALRSAVEQQLTPYLPQFRGTARGQEQTRFFLSSGTAEAAAEAIAAARGESTQSINGVRFTLADLQGLLQRVLRTKPALRPRIRGLEKRLDTIVAGLTVLCSALELLGASGLTVSEGALREGMLTEELSRFESFSSGLSPRQRSVLATAERYGVNLAHAQQVAELSRQLLDALTQHGEAFPDDARSLLTAAAALHESGQIVSQSGHHKHSAYLIRNSGLRGFSPRDIELIALTARYHRRSLPRAAHGDYMALAPAERHLLSRLAAILRVADGLDRAHTGNVRIEGLEKHKSGWTLHLSGTTPLDLAGVHSKADLWEKEFGPIGFRA